MMRLGLLALLAAAIPACATASESGNDAVWTVTLGVEGRVEPTFDGARSHVFTPYPLIDVRRAGTPENFRAPRDGLSIAPWQAALSGLPVYATSGGLHSVGEGAQVRYRLTPELATHAFVEFEQLTTGAAHSPLVQKRGSADQWTLGLGVTRSFDVKQFW